MRRILLHGKFLFVFLMLLLSVSSITQRKRRPQKQIDWAGMTPMQNMELPFIDTSFA